MAGSKVQMYIKVTDIGPNHFNPLMADIRQDIYSVSTFSRCLNRKGTLTQIKRVTITNLPSSELTEYFLRGNLPLWHLPNAKLLFLYLEEDLPSMM